MTEQAIGTAFHFEQRGRDLPDLLRQVARTIEGLGDDAEVLDVTVHPTTVTAGVYFVRRSTTTFKDLRSPTRLEWGRIGRWHSPARSTPSRSCARSIEPRPNGRSTGDRPA